ncbi:hypothetical protein PVK06_027720 [Gossypium arboreum]|uniref:Uncharacterized protein n=1 Tax=Gossypium arboreum TaxID=29729 RepID=A0ABR0P3N7_GOSAR|nr:hypothetical protein PVK06_027720 [Gossypium arboreum]
MSGAMNDDILIWGPALNRVYSTKIGTIDWKQHSIRKLDKDASRVFLLCYGSVGKLKMWRLFKRSIVDRWSSLSDGLLKINVDVAWNNDKRHVMVGIVIRDHEGLVRASFACKVVGKFDA